MNLHRQANGPHHSVFTGWMLSLPPNQQCQTTEGKSYLLAHSTTPQPFYGPFSGTTRVSRCQKRTSGLYGARED